MANQQHRVASDRAQAREKRKASEQERAPDSTLINTVRKKMPPILEGFVTYHNDRRSQKPLFKEEEEGKFRIILKDIIHSLSISPILFLLIYFHLYG